MSDSVDAELIAGRIAALRRRIDDMATRPVTIVGVTKRFGVDAVGAAIDAGLIDLGENYAQELAAKDEALRRERPDAEVRWHFIGHLQRNKVKTIAGAVSLWQSVDSERLGSEIARRAPGARVLVQVNLAANPDQGGVEPEAVEPLVNRLGSMGLEVAGLMMIGRPGDRDRSAAAFRDLRARADALGLAECSMGMSDDLDLAVAAGATIVRVGTAIFGPRPD